MAVSALLLACVLTAAALVAADDIKCFPTDDNGNEVTDSKGRRYDLSSLRRRPPQAEWRAKDLTEKNEYIYTINICDRIYSDRQASDTHAAVWQVKADKEDEVFECGDASTAKITLIEDGALRLTYNEGGHCHRADVDRNTIVTFVCKERLPADNQPSLIREDNCTYVFQWLTPAACPVDQDEGRMTAGGVFFLIAFLGLIVYFGCGAAYRRLVLQKSGTDVVPNYDMWSNLLASVTTCLQGLWMKVARRGGPARGQPGTVHYRGLRTTDGSQDSLIAEEDDDQLLDS